MNTLMQTAVETLLNERLGRGSCVFPEDSAGEIEQVCLWCSRLQRLEKGHPDGAAFTSNPDYNPVSELCFGSGHWNVLLEVLKKIQHLADVGVPAWRMQLTV